MLEKNNNEQIDIFLEVTLVQSVVICLTIPRGLGSIPSLSSGKAMENQ